MYISFLHILEHVQQTTSNPFYHFGPWVFTTCKPFVLFYYFSPLAFTRSTLFYSISSYFQCFLAQLGVVSGQLTGMLFHGRLWIWCLKGSEPCIGASCLLGQCDLCPALRSWIRTPLGAAAHTPTVADAGCLCVECVSVHYIYIFAYVCESACVRL